MAMIPILSPPGTGAISSTPISTANYQYVMFAANLTADTIAVKVQLPDGAGTVNAADINGVYTGLATAAPTRIYIGGPDYVLVRTGSADTAGVYMFAGADVS